MDRRGLSLPHLINMVYDLAMRNIGFHILSGYWADDVTDYPAAPKRFSSTLIDGR